MGLGQSTMEEKRKKKETAENVKQAPSRLSDFIKSRGNFQEYAKKRKEKEKPAEPKAVEPSKGFIQRMMDKYWYKKKEN